MAPAYKGNASAIKRIMSEVKEMDREACDEFRAAPTEDNLFEWHFTLRGPEDSEFESGMYHGKILLPTEYPFRPPHVVFLTPNGRWDIHCKICLTFTGHHEEEWQPAWGIRTALLGVRALMSSPVDESAMGAIRMPRKDREKLAQWCVSGTMPLMDSSAQWECTLCGKSNKELLPPMQRDVFSAPPLGQTNTDDVPGARNGCMAGQRISAAQGEVVQDSGAELGGAQLDGAPKEAGLDSGLVGRSAAERGTMQGGGAREETVHAPSAAQSRPPSAAFETSASQTESTWRPPSDDHLSLHAETSRHPASHTAPTAAAAAAPHAQQPRGEVPALSLDTLQSQVALYGWAIAALDAAMGTICALMVLTLLRNA
ncbi:E2 ubiquitin-conjugating enzyme [Malassezia sp. CBS 17886]|nr:E2 ubiquitin-conjugating enzyme [Malassezia sp. CBS 17886]